MRGTPGATVVTDTGLKAVLIDRAAPSGWWARTAASTATPSTWVRLVQSRRRSDLEPVWRVVR